LISSQIFPSLLVYARNLIDFGLYKLALNYLDFIIDQRNSFFQLSKNMAFINEIMSLQESANKCVSTQGNRSSLNEGGGEKRAEQMKPMKGGFGLFNLVSNTIEKLMTSDEGNVSTKKSGTDSKPLKEEDKNPQYYYDPVIKQWIINGKPPEDDEINKKNRYSKTGIICTSSND